MNPIQKVVLLLVSVLSLFLIYFGVFAGEFLWYTFGFLLLLAIIVYSSLFMSSGKSLFLPVVTVFLILRYVPILKFNQPLYEDPVSDLAVATQFERASTASVLSKVPIDYVRTYSGWPLIHLMTITIHYATGLSLFDVFTYFPPLLDLSSLLFVYLLANHIFENSKIGALSGLLYATFSINMFWVGTQIIRQNIAFSLALMAVYLYIRGKTNKKMVVLSLLVFGILPIAHHLTAMEMFYILSATLLLNLLLNYREKIFHKILRKATKFKGPKLRTSISSPFTLTSCFFIGVSIFLYWITYPRDIILRLFFARIFSILNGVLSMEPKGDLPQRMMKIEARLDIFDILTYIRALLLGVMTLYGVFVLSKEQNRHRSLLYGFLLAPLSLLLIVGFIEFAADWRHYLFFLIPVFLLSAKSISRFDKDKFNKKVVFGLCLLIIVFPAPFKLFRTLDSAPKFIYDRNSQFDFALEKSVIIYRNEKVMAATSFMANSASGNLIADFHTALGLLFNYDVYKVCPLQYVIQYQVVSSPKHVLDTIVIDNEFYYAYQIERLLYQNFTETVERLNSLPEKANCIYNNGEVVTWKIP